MASIGSEQAPRWQWRASSWRAALGGSVARVHALFADGSESSLARRLAGAAFLIRVVSAAIAFVSQILLARWMGVFEFGVYVYTWTWVLLIGGMVDLGLGSAAQRFIPEYTEHGKFALLRGYLGGSRWLATGIATGIAVLGAAAVFLLSPHIGRETVIPLYLACAALPLCGLAQVQSGIARSYNWVNLGLAPVYIQRQLALLALMGIFYTLGLPTDATTATLAGVVSLWGVTIGQFLVLNRRLTRVVERGAKVSCGWFLARHLDADLRCRSILSAAHLCRRHCPPAISLAERSRDLLRRGQDHGARRLHLFLGGADNRAQVRAISRYR